MAKFKLKKENNYVNESEKINDNNEKVEEEKNENMVEPTEKKFIAKVAIWKVLNLLKIDLL